MVVDEVSVTHVVVLLLVAAVVIEWIWGLWRRTRYDLHKIPGPTSLPLFGHVHLLPLLLPVWGKLRITAKMHEWALKYGKLYKLNMLVDDVVVIHDPKFIEKHVLAGGKTDIPKVSTYDSFNKMMSPYNMHSLFTSPKADAKYKSFRKTMACAFSSEALKRGFPQLLEKSKQVGSKIATLAKDGTPFDMQDLGVRFSLDCIGHFAYGLNFNSVGKTTHPLLEALEFTCEDSFADHLNPFREPFKKIMSFTPSGKKIKGMYNILYHEYDKIMQAIDFEDAPAGEDDRSIRAQLMRLRNPLENDRKASWEEIYAEMATFIFAGTDTTGHQVAWALMCLATHPEVQERVFEELVENGLAGKGCRDPEFADLNRLSYLNNVVKESLRRIPVAPSCGPRRLEEDMDVLGYRVPKGTILVCQAHTLNTCPWSWENGEDFDPERWATKGERDFPEEVKLNNPSQKTWTFGFGVRNCVGQRLAMLELQLLLAVLLAKFRFTLESSMGGWDGALKRGFNSLVFTCEGGMWMKATPRFEKT
ncbi:hypothetical protein BSKO_09039 [Bryopsis sp. KO-2023]|nr:hypothetical protein BSKO_09039 [Bryopsis sp. KO-2023]